MKKLNTLSLLLFLNLSLSLPAMVVNSKQASTRTSCYVEIGHNINSKHPSKEDDSSVGNLSILNAAEDTLGDSSQDIPKCAGGRLACAAMVTRVLNRAGVTEIHTDCTSDMNDQLCHSSHFKKVSVSDASPGDIIISPSEGHTCGHVGIVGKRGLVYSNNSYSARFDCNFTVKTWESYFGNHKDLEVYVYRKI